ncbi:histidine phosphatase family protein [Actinomadura vinacea]|uniref:histidine phosphatase family protein n=1 Tax=Actinomadura vinacea TaxID=115336 RepID=UPI0031D2E580
MSNDSVRYMAQPRDFTTFTLEASERACLDLAISYCDSGFLPILDGVYEDVEFLESQALRFDRRGCKLITISLTAEMADLVERNNLRDPLQRMDEARLQQLHSSYQVVGYPLPIRGKLPEEVCDDILDIIEQERPDKRETLIGEDEVDLLFMRHGAPDYPAGVYPDPFTMGLSARGRAEARAAQPAIRRFAPDVVISSDFARAVETAELATAGTELKTEVNEALRERVFLQLVGKEVSAILAEMGADGQSIMGGNSDAVELAQDESYADARERVLDFFGSLPARYGGKRVLVVGHGGPHQWLVEQALGVDLKGVRRYRWDTGSFSRFTLTARETRLEAMNLGPSAVVPGRDLGAV